MATQLFCTRCGVTLPADAHFCPTCGAKVNPESTPARTPLTLRGKIGIGCIALGLLMFGWFTQQSLGGMRPLTPMVVPTAANSSSAQRGTTDAKGASESGDSAEIIAARSELAGAPENVSSVRKLAVLLLKKLNENPQPRQADVLEVIDLLSRVLKEDPKDADALLSMADISFNQQVFAKSAEYYERYLSLHSDDLDARARYASSLSFNGKFEQAERELQNVLEKTPDAFQPLAYLSVLYVQMGKKDQAIAAGEKALLHAPSAEVRERYGSFLAAVRTTDATDAVAATTGIARAEVDLSSLDEFIRANPIAGPKYVGSKLLEGSLVILQFREFPMASMPAMVREKFSKSIVEKAQTLSLPADSFLLFQEVSTSEEMLKVPVYSQ